MPKLHWRTRPESTVTRDGTAAPSRPGTQDSGRGPEMPWLGSPSNSSRSSSSNGGNGSGFGTGGRANTPPPDLLRLHAHAPNFKTVHTFDDPLDTFRPHTNKEVGTRTRSGASRGAPGSRQLRSESVQGLRAVTAKASNVAPNSDGRSPEDDVVEGRAPERDPLPRHGLRRRQDVALRDYLAERVQGNDIMAQSMRRQSLRGSKHNLHDGVFAHLEASNIVPASGSRMTMNMNGTLSPEQQQRAAREGMESAGGPGEPGMAPRKVVAGGPGLPKFIPNSHEDIQILNLQGFMDSSSYVSGEGGRNLHHTGGVAADKKKHRKRRHRTRTSVDGGGGEGGRTSRSDAIGLKSRRRRNRAKGHRSDDDDNEEVLLRDVDDLDTRLGGLVLGPAKPPREHQGRPILLEEASGLRTMLTGSPAQLLPYEWMTQNFKRNMNPNLSYGLVQKKGGPCGVLATVQAYMMKNLIYGSSLCPTVSPVSPLRPSIKEWTWALSVALSEIIWRAGQHQKALLVLPGSFAHFSDHGVGRYSRDGLTETLTIHEFVEEKDLYNVITRHLMPFTAENSPGCVLLLYSLLLSRSLANVRNDMDAGGGHLINAHGYCSQEVVNLALTGRAVTNTFNGDETLGDAMGSSCVVLRGIQHRADIGLLSLFQHYGSCKVGSHLLSPQYPVWVVCSESHFSVLFGRDKEATSDDPVMDTFDLYYYDGLALQEDEIRLTIRVHGGVREDSVVPPLELCIRTKWPNASVEWNGTEPIL
ncbi:putative ubiquitin carboxyl-terminal hydrolase MINDY-4 isoform X2 [Oratosquilla oratoria]|uniref:putative ubiquitin carboxyl-terminal hydrolase MINDY-4 isoform X2 n=1 Tax=Oratosquilla oratoria TaxID=337810 RepID=UPI003F7648BD